MSKPMSCLLALTTTTLGMAGATTAKNLSLFRSVCVNVGYEVQGRVDEDRRADLYDAILRRLSDAGIRTAKSPCQDSGSAGSGQLNLYYDYSTTESGKAYLGSLEGWVSREGKLSEPSVWYNFSYGVPGNEDLDDLATDTMNDLMDDFLKDWKANR